MVRVDSDDLLSRDFVARLRSLDPNDVRAVYNKRAHVFDIAHETIGDRLHPHATTCNAVFCRAEGNRLANWFYLCFEHTHFEPRVKAEGIPCAEWDYTYCIVAHTGNHISGRPAIDSERDIAPVQLTPQLVERYGLDYHLRRPI